MSILIDSKNGFEIALVYAKKKSLKLEVWIDIDTGYHRTGLPFDEQSTFDLVHEMHQYPNQIYIRGVYNHGGDSYHGKNKGEIKTYSNQEKNGICSFLSKCKLSNIPKFNCVAIGSTPSCSVYTDDWEEINEIHPGNYIFYDTMQATIGSCNWDSNATFVLTSVLTVYSKPPHISCDSGALALSKDLGPNHITSSIEYGHIVDYNQSFSLSLLTQELGIIKPRDTFDGDLNEVFKSGQKIMIIPNHSCLSCACFPKIFILDQKGGIIIDVWETCPRIW